MWEKHTWNITTRGYIEDLVARKLCFIRLQAEIGHGVWIEGNTVDTDLRKRKRKPLESYEDSRYILISLLKRTSFDAFTSFDEREKI